MSRLFPSPAVIGTQIRTTVLARSQSTYSYMEQLCAEYWLNEARKGSFLPTHSSNRILSSHG